MKNFEGFRASVYARAQARRMKIRERNLKIRGALLSVAMIALAVVMAVPVVRTGRIFDPGAVIEREITQEYVIDPARQLGEPPPPRMVLLMGVPGNGAAEVVVLDSDAKQKSFVTKYKQDNHMPAEEDPTLTDALEAPKTLRSTDELTEFLQELPRTNDSMQQIISDYDEDFFANNVLCCMPMDIAPADLNDFGLEYDLPANQAGEDGSEAETVPETETIPETGEAAGFPMAYGEEQPLPPPPTQLSEELLQENDVKVLLLVPMNKAQGEAIPQILS